MAESTNPYEGTMHDSRGNDPENDFNWGDENTQRQATPMFPKDFENADDTPTVMNENRYQQESVDAMLAQRDREIRVSAKMSALSIAGNLDSINTADELLDAADKIFKWALRDEG